MKFLVGLAFCVDLVVLQREQDVYLRCELFNLRFYVGFTNLLVYVKIVYLAENHNSKNADLRVKLKRVLRPRVARLSSVTEPTHNFVGQQI